jgi:hypothetical protein
MNANRNIWQFVCAAIVLIAVQFAPALARAHNDQAHRHVHVHDVAPHGKIVADTPVAYSSAKAAVAMAALADTIAAAPHERLLTAGQTPGSAPVDSDGCVNGCCGASMGCCGGAALPAPPRFYRCRACVGHRTRKPAQTPSTARLSNDIAALWRPRERTRFFSGESFRCPFHSVLRGARLLY